MCFHAGAPDIKSIMGHVQITSLSSAVGMDIRIAYIKLRKLGILSCRHWYTKTNVIYTLISVMDNKLLAAIRGHLWA